MHIIISLITAIVGLLWVLVHLGVNVHSLNPFNWHRRSQWQKKYNTKALHLLERPIEAATVLLISIVNAEGLVSREQKDELLRLFKEEFEQSESQAADYFGSGVFLLKDTPDVVPEVPHILSRSKPSFTTNQIQTLTDLMEHMASFESEASDKQKALIQVVKDEFYEKTKKPGEW